VILPNHPVFDLMLRRVQSGSRPGSRSDPFKLGLAIEGGSMRGVISAGLTAALYFLGFRDAFDTVYGCSSGSYSGAFLAANQDTYGLAAYYRHVNNSKLFSLWRAAHGLPILDIRYLTHHVLKHEIVLDWRAVTNSALPLKVIASSVHTGDIVLLQDFTSQDDLLESLHASCRVPIMTGSTPLPHRGDLLWDGGLADPFGIRAALQDGCTHVLVLRSRPVHLQKRKVRLLDRYIAAPHIRKWSPALAERYLHRHDPAWNGTALLDRSLGDHSRTPYLASLSLPSGAQTVRGLEMRPQVLMAAAESSIRAGLRAFGVTDATPHLVLGVYGPDGHHVRLPYGRGTHQQEESPFHAATEGARNGETQ
jgi:predicted patatin/cPLA2 family phospholipase